MQNAHGFLAKLAVFVLVASCALFEPQSKVKSGQLFQTGQAQYDDYFNKVHQLQVEAAGFADDKKASRRNLIDALKIATDAVDVTILQAAHERLVSIAHVTGPTRLDLRDDEGKVIITSEAREDLSMRDFVKSLQSTVDSEIKRKNTLRDVPGRCDELAKIGRDLEPRVKGDFFRQGGTTMADVHDEIAASFEVLDDISKNARLDRRETEDFIADLGRAVFAEPAEYGRSAGEVVAQASTTKPQAHAEHVEQPKPHVATATTTTAPKPKPQPKPPSGGGGDEVFNP